MRKNAGVYLGLGGNIGNVLPRLNEALVLLSRTKEIKDLQISHFYRTAPFQMESQNWFINAVCSFHTELSPQEVIKLTQTIETQLGKNGKPKNADRPIDIDLLFYGCNTHQDFGLEIPHPRWKERLFVLIPLKDLIDEVVIQGQQGVERYRVDDLIQPLLDQSPQIIRLPLMFSREKFELSIA